VGNKSGETSLSHFASEISIPPFAGANSNSRLQLVGNISAFLVVGTNSPSHFAGELSIPPVAGANSNSRLQLMENNQLYKLYKPRNTAGQALRTQ